MKIKLIPKYKKSSHF